MKPTLDASNCILVQDVKSVTHDHMMQNADGVTPLPTEESLPASTAEHSFTTQLQQQNQQQQQQQLNQQVSGGGGGGGGGNSNGIHSSLSQAYPDSQYIAQQAHQTQQKWPVLELREFNEIYHATIPPYQFWNSEFKNKHPAFIRFNFTLPWGANFAVYGRRNVSPSVTQYDFAEFIKGGRIDNRLRKRRRRSADDDDGNVAATATATAVAGHGASNGNAHTTAAVVGHYHSINDRMLFDINNYYEHARDIMADENDGDDDNDANTNDHDDDDGNRNMNRDERRNHNDDDVLSHVSFLMHGNAVAADAIPVPPPPPPPSSAMLSKPNFQFSSAERHVIAKRSAIDATPTLDIDTMMVNVSLLQYLDTGRWFLAVYNDELLAHSVTLIVSEAEGVSTTCLNDCSGRGSCYLGKCDCIDGFQGVDCSKSKYTHTHILIQPPVSNIFSRVFFLSLFLVTRSDIFAFQTHAVIELCCVTDTCIIPLYMATYA